MEWVLTLHDVTVIKPRSLALEVGWLGWGRWERCGMEFGCRRRVSGSGYVNVFTILRTISSNGAAVKPPPCMHQAEE
jgi:hypothetical protein